MLETTMSVEIGDIALALSKAQAELPIIKKDQAVDFTHNGRRTNYSYADLSKFVGASSLVLSKYEIAVLQPSTSTQDGKVGIQTILVHSSGQWFKSPILFMPPSGTKPQDIGATLSYARRYSLISFLNMVSEADDDDAVSQQTSRINSIFDGGKEQMEAITLLFNKYGLHKDARRKLTDWLIEKKHPFDKPSLEKIISASAEKAKASKEGIKNESQ